MWTISIYWIESREFFQHSRVCVTAAKNFQQKIDLHDDVQRHTLYNKTLLSTLQFTYNFLF